VFHAGLTRSHRGLAEVEKAIQNAGTVEMSFLEKNMIWLNLVVTIAPMLGFTGTVAGMVGAFDAIEAANNISPAVVAGGISQALLTTAFGLIVAIIIQLLQNFFVSRIDRLVLDMEENSMQLVDHLYEMESGKKAK
jgi:biopolymer transport protein ExbB